MSAFITALKLVPKNAVSRALGAVLRAPMPAPIARSVIKKFAAAYRVETGDAERDYLSYPTFNAFFTRRLREGARAIAAGDDVAVCPVDGTVGQIGRIENGTLIQAKGREYTLREFLVDEADAAAFEGGTFATLYLAPYNYHRIHVPLAGRITGWAYVPGHLWPVNAKGVAEIDKLFAVNERLITYEDTAAGQVAIVKVGATCVGRIRATYDDVVTNDRMERAFRRVRFEQPIDAKKADECGVFEMGSTVIVLFQKDRATLDAAIVPGATIRMGQVLAKVT